MTIYCPLESSPSQRVSRWVGSARGEGYWICVTGTICRLAEGTHIGRARNFHRHWKKNVRELVSRTGSRSTPWRRDNHMDNAAKFPIKSTTRWADSCRLRVADDRAVHCG